MNPKLKMLCELYDRSDESISIDALLKICFFKKLKDVLELLTHKQRVKFAYLCAKSVFHLNNEKTKEKAEKCLKLVEKWLENPNSVSCYKLRKVANAAANAAANASANVAAYAATNAVYSVYSPTNIAYAAYSAADASDAENKQEQEYKNLGFLVKVIRDEP